MYRTARESWEGALTRGWHGNCCGDRSYMHMHMRQRVRAQRVRALSSRVIDAVLGEAAAEELLARERVTVIEFVAH